MISSQIIDLLSLAWRWIPIRFTVVHEYEQGILWSMGRAKQLIENPGVCWYIPFVQSISTDSVVPQIAETSMIAVHDSEEKPWGISATIRYRVVNLMEKELNISDSESAMLDVVERAISAVYPENDNPWPAIRRRVRRQIEGWGIEVEEMGPVNLTSVSPYFVMRPEGIEPE